MIGRFDMEAFKKAFEAADVDAVLKFYASDVEHIEIDADSPPKAPRTSGVDFLRSAIGGATEAGIKFRMDNAVVGDDRVACTITVELPDGRWLLSNTIYDLKGGKITRQLDIQVMDPEPH